MLGVEIVTKHGQPAPRLLLAWRQIVIWAAPVLLFAAIIIIANRKWTPLPIAAVVVGLILTPAALYLGLKTPERSLAERLSGTMMVPE